MYLFHSVRWCNVNTLVIGAPLCGHPKAAQTEDNLYAIAQAMIKDLQPSTQCGAIIEVGGPRIEHLL